MAFYENTLVVRQDLPKAELDKIKNKYNELIKNNSGKVVKIEEWGLIDFADKIKNFNKGFFIHFKFDANQHLLTLIKEKIKVDRSIIRNLIVKYKKLDTNIEYFNKSKSKDEKKK